MENLAQFREERSEINKNLGEKKKKFWGPENERVNYIILHSSLLKNK